MKRQSFCHRCSGIKEGKNCDQCKPSQIRPRQTTTERGYGGDWQKVSKAYRAENPLCEDCCEEGRTTPSTQVHHKVPIEDDYSLRLEQDNLVALCEDCHHKRHTKGNQ